MSLKRINKNKSSQRRLIFVILIFIIATLLMTYPLVTRLNSSLPGYLIPIDTNKPKVQQVLPSDTLNIAYRLWLVKHNVLNSTLPVIDQFQYNFEGSHIEGMSLWIFPFQLIHIPLSALTNDVFSLNFIYLLSYFLAGLCMFVLVKHYTKSTIAALFAALVFAFLPSRVLHSSGHSGAYLYFIYPLTIYLIEKYYKNKNILYLMGSFLLIISLALGEWHLFYYFVGFVIAFFIYKILFANNKKKVNHFTPIVFTASSLIIGITYLLIISRLNFENSVVGSGRSYGEVASFSPSLKHLFFNVFDVEFNLYLGKIVLLILLSGLVLFIANFKKTSKFIKRNVFFFVLVFLLSCSLAIGTNNPLYIYLYKYLPYFDTMRVPGRIMILVSTCFSVILGYSILLIKNYFEKKKIINFFVPLVIIMFVLTMIDFRIFHKSRFDITLAKYRINGSAPRTELNNIINEKVAPGKKILYLPYYKEFDFVSSLYQYNTRQTKRAMLNGYTPTIPLEEKEAYEGYIKPLNNGKITQKSMAGLKTYDVTHIVIYKNYVFKQSKIDIKTIERNIIESELVDIVYENNEEIIFELK